MIWFLSDPHFDHFNMILHARRPWPNINAMGDALVENHNSLVKPNDVVYIIGDFAFKNIKAVHTWMPQLNGNKHFIRGGHDIGPDSLYLSYCKSVSEYVKIIQVEGCPPIVMCHYEMAAYPHSHYGAWHLYGHYHSSKNSGLEGKRLNVCLDLHNYKPLSLDEVKRIMANKPLNWDDLKRFPQKRDDSLH